MTSYDSLLCLPDYLNFSVVTVVHFRTTPCPTYVPEFRRDFNVLMLSLTSPL